ncbi:unnamed protein product [Euphydryas editha]|uniref:Uncharacterized protein n=1 Tax=Euphydryas editha TaxID=104508 RepID=A0AAU9TQB4_EUPED|nr:unnamed protein product [Euphydryas editha]
MMNGAALSKAAVYHHSTGLIELKNIRPFSDFSCGKPRRKLKKPPTTGHVVSVPEDDLQRKHFKVWSSTPGKDTSITNADEYNREEKSGQPIPKLTALPLMDGHYYRKSSAKLYLQSGWPSNVQFTNSTTKKDEYKLCSAYKSGNIQQSDYEKHIPKKDEARNEKNKDKDSEKHIFAMVSKRFFYVPSLTYQVCTIR